MEVTLDMWRAARERAGVYQNDQLAWTWGFVGGAASLPLGEWAENLIVHIGAEGAVEALEQVVPAEAMATAMKASNERVANNARGLRLLRDREAAKGWTWKEGWRRNAELAAAEAEEEACRTSPKGPAHPLTLGLGDEARVAARKAEYRHIIRDIVAAVA